MKAKVCLAVVLVSLIPLSNAFPEEYTFEGDISAGGTYRGVKGEDDAKFFEYSDDANFMFNSRIRLLLDSEKYFLGFDATDIGYSTQDYRLEGGMWGKFDLTLDYSELPHNISFDAKTFYEGAGGDTLTGTANTNVESWNTFDYSTERKKGGAGFKLNMLKPFYLDVSYSREKKDGIKVAGIAETSPGGISIELPEPVDYTTDSLNVEAGYAKNPFFASLSYYYSQFDNRDPVLNFINPDSGDLDTLTLPPDSKFYKLAFKGAVKLPYQSKFQTNIGAGKTESDHDFFSTFDGEVETKNYDFVLTSVPLNFLDVKVFYRYDKRDNDSDESTGTVFKFFDYKKDAVGADVGVRLPKRFYITGGYKYVNTERRNDGETDPEAILPYNKDSLYSVNLTWSGLDFMMVRLGYEKLDRNADYRTEETDLQPQKVYAYAAQDADAYTLSVDVFPMEDLSFNVGFKYKDVDYTDTEWGLTGDKRYLYNVDGDYTIKDIVKLFAYIDYEQVTYDQFQHKVSDPQGDWSVKEKSRNFGYGIGAESGAILDGLTLKFEHYYLKSNGNVDLTFFDSGLFPTGGDNDNIDIARWDDYTLYGFKLTGIYHLTLQLDLLAGYAYERYRYSDAQFNDYQYVPATSGSNGAFLTGAYRDQSYTANVIFGGVTYKF
jgi:MtrB/PioB family decaheme-associated outer membrane protein